MTAMHNTPQITFTKDCGIATSTEAIFIPLIGEAMELWIYTESERFADFSPHQRTCFDAFVALPSQREMIAQAVKDLYEEQLRERRIEQHPTDSFCPEYTACIVPNLSDVTDSHIFIIAETNWSIAGSDCCLEIEFYFIDNRLHSLSEMTGDYTLFGAE
ncbi:hypothetical protein [Capnocytophaga haemolytica]